AALQLRRPMLVITPLPREAEALAGEIAFFLGESSEADSANRRVHLLRAWETTPLAHLSPPLDNQSAQLEALFALLRLEAPLVVASVEALMMRTIPRRQFDSAVIKLALADRIDF